MKSKNSYHKGYIINVHDECVFLPEPNMAL